MKTFVLAIALVMSAGVAVAQRRARLPINDGTPEGQLLLQIGQEQNEERKVQLGDMFLEKYANHEGVPWVLGTLQPLYLKAGQLDKAIAAGEKMLAADPEDSEAAYGALQGAEGKKDPDLVVQWSNRTSEIARKVAARPKPEAEDEVETWKATVDYAKQLDIRTEYSFYAQMLATADTQKKIALGEALEKRNPDSQYIPQMAEPWILAYQQTGNQDRARAVAEKVALKDQSNETVLITAADATMTKQDYEKAAAYGEKLVALMSSRPKPAGFSDADWEKKKNFSTGLGYWYAGIAYVGQSKWPEADQALRSALPLVKENEQLLAAALFNAGLANHGMKKMPDAAGFFEQCSKIQGPYQEQAQKNLKAVRKK
jgi:tetratricopeptide (TPR) repeat protein